MSQQELGLSELGVPGTRILDGLIYEDEAGDHAQASMAADFPEYGQSVLRLAYKPWFLWKFHELTCEHCSAERLGGEVCEAAAIYLRSLQGALKRLAARKA